MPRVRRVPHALLRMACDRPGPNFEGCRSVPLSEAERATPSPADSERGEVLAGIGRRLVRFHATRRS